MRNFKIVVSYDGTRYKGWQTLGDCDTTIQGKLQMVLEKFAGEPVEVIGSGRTDAGVHARGQVANFHMEKACTTQEVLEYLNRYLPEDIAVHSVELVDNRFHSRYNAISKTYRYRIHTSTIPDVFARKYMYTYTDAPLDVSAMQEAAELLKGTHDFASFCGNKRMKKSTERTITDISIERVGDDIVMDYTGNGFLQNMVRILVGTLIEIGSGRRKAGEISDILDAKDRARAGYTAPPQGLTLMRVEYGKMGSLWEKG